MTPAYPQPRDGNTMEVFTISFTDPTGKVYKTTVKAPDIGTAKHMVKENYPWSDNLKAE